MSEWWLPIKLIRYNIESVIKNLWYLIICKSIYGTTQTQVDGCKQSTYKCELTLQVIFEKCLGEFQLVTIFNLLIWTCCMCCAHVTHSHTLHKCWSLNIEAWALALMWVHQLEPERCRTYKSFMVAWKSIIINCYPLQTNGTYIYLQYHVCKYRWYCYHCTHSFIQGTKVSWILRILGHSWKWIVNFLQLQCLVRTPRSSLVNLQK